MQYAPAGYVGLWTRLRDFERGSLTAALERKTAVQATLMRATIHLVSARDYWPMALGVREARRSHYLRLMKTDAGEVERAAERARELLEGKPMRAPDLQKAIGANNELFYGVSLWLDLVRVPPSGTWDRRRADLLTTAEQWLGPPKTTAELGVELLVKRYLSGFGPAGVKDVATWAGLRPGDVSAALARMRVAIYRDESGRELVDLPGAPIPDAGTQAPVRFLPVWDATLLVHARQAQVLAEEHRPLVFNTKTPHSVGTFLVDGAVAGTWRLAGARVVPEPFSPLSRAVRREVDEEAARLSEFHI